MEIIFLGTSSGTPTKTRNVSAIVIRKQNSKQWSLIDCGEGTQHQILHTNLSLKYLETIYITHIHGDHCYGLSGLLASATMLSRTQPLKIVAPHFVKLFFEAMQKYTELHLSFKVEFILTEEYTKKIIQNNFEVEPIKLSHRVPSWGYLFTEKNIEVKLNIEKLKQDNIPKGKIWGLLQKEKFVTLENNEIIQSNLYHLKARKPRKIAISGDNDTPSLWWKFKYIDLVVHESTYTEEISQKIGKSVGHSSSEDVARFASKYQLKNLILTHFSPRYNDDKTQINSIQEIEDEARKFYKEKLFLANDFDIYFLDMHAQLSKKNFQLPQL